MNSCGAMAQKPIARLFQRMRLANSAARGCASAQQRPGQSGLDSPFGVRRQTEHSRSQCASITRNEPSPETETVTFVDLSYPLSSNTPLFPGTPCVELESIERTEDPPPTGRRSLNVTRLSMVVHTGTHMDAPFHFFPSGLTIDQMPLEQCMGPASLLKLTDLATGSEIDLTAVPGLKDKLSRTRKLILNTGWARHWGSPRYFTDHPRISAESAAFLVDCGINLIGVDMPS